ncbi:3'-5' exonuclease [Micromonospora trifolii]|uniref:3'-5' exonuclease n=1 Tax=Micromonospora trifolii TaxID=2911208 RepID=UPI003D2EA589
MRHLRVRGDEGLSVLRDVSETRRAVEPYEVKFDDLTAATVPTVRVRDNPEPEVDGVRLATMHAMKGLEFRCVAVVGVNASAVPFAKEVTPREVDQVQHDSDMMRERCLLFVATTRAREALNVSRTGTPSARSWPESRAA